MKFPLAPDFIKYVPVLSNHKYDIDYTNKTIHQSFPAGEEQKHLRIFPDQTSALEFLDYLLKQIVRTQCSLYQTILCWINTATQVNENSNQWLFVYAMARISRGA